MRITAELTDEAILTELGRRVTRLRLDRNVSQERFAEDVGVGRATVQRIEAGASVQLTSLLRVLRGLGLADGLEALVPMPTPSPMQELRLAGRRRRRSGRSAGTDGPAGPWTWGDEQGDRDR